MVHLAEKIASTVWTYPTSIDDYPTEAFTEENIEGANIAVVDFESIELPQATKYLVARKLKEKYDYVVGQCRVLYDNKEWYLNANKIDFLSLEIVDRAKRVVYYGSDVVPEDTIECVEEEWIDRVDSISLTYRVHANGEVAEEVMKLDRYIDADSVRIKNLVYLTAHADDKLRDAVNILLAVLFDVEYFQYESDEMSEALSPRFYFIGEAVSYLGDFFGDQKEAVRILIESGIEDNLLTTCVPEGMTATIVIADGKAKVRVDYTSDS